MKVENEDEELIKLRVLFNGKLKVENWKWRRGTLFSWELFNGNLKVYPVESFI